METKQIDFLIVGAAKSGTTWLQRALQQDSKIYMPDPELHFFSRCFDRGISSYLQQFEPPGGAEIVGEKSNSYLDDPAAPQRIADALPHVRIVAQLRNPVERAYSDYCMLLRRGEVSADIAAHLSVDSPCQNRFIRGGMYYSQLSLFFDRFPADRIMILVYDDMLSDPAGHLRRLAGFLGAGDRGGLPERVKDRATPLLPLPLRQVLAPLKPLARPFRQHPVLKATHRALARQVKYPPLPYEVRQRLAEYYAPEIDGLQGLLGRDLSPWLTAPRPNEAA